MKTMLLLLVVVVAGCATADKLVHAEAPQDGQQGIRVALKGGGPLAGNEATLENVGSYTSVPPGWQGPFPPGWTPPALPAPAPAEAP